MVVSFSTLIDKKYYMCLYYDVLIRRLFFGDDYMSKILVIPSNFDEIEKEKDKVDGFIIGIEGYSVNVNFCIHPDNLNILNNIDKDIFICLNKNMHNSDLTEVKKIMKELDKYNIKGLMYYDVGILNIYNSLDLKYNLVCSQEHMATNYKTINYWNSFGVKYTYLSSDITVDEIKEISKNTNSKLIVNLFGYLPMFVSKRHIVKNYLDYFNLSDDSSVNYIEKEDNIYPIIDNSIGTTCYSSSILNGIKASIDIDVDYIVLNSFNIELDKFLSVIDMFRSANKDNALEYDRKISSMFDNTDYGFLYTKTIYRVKNNEK